MLTKTSNVQRTETLARRLGNHHTGVSRVKRRHAYGA